MKVRSGRRLQGAWPEKLTDGLPLTEIWKTVDGTDWEGVDQKFHSGHHRIDRPLDLQTDCERGSSLTHHHSECTDTAEVKCRGLELYLKLFLGPWIHFLPRIMLMSNYPKHCPTPGPHETLCIMLMDHSYMLGAWDNFPNGPLKSHSDPSAPALPMPAAVECRQSPIQAFSLSALFHACRFLPCTGTQKGWSVSLYGPHLAQSLPL